jgi:menaquinone-9 beta-reductase
MSIDAVSSFTASDLFIVGGGPSGLACAIAAAQLGLRVEIADSRRPPIDKACGEGLLPDALAALEQLGVPLGHLQSFGVPFRGIRFIQSRNANREDSSAEADFPAGFGLGIRRTILHDILTNRALALGVRFHWQTVVAGVENSRIHTNRGLFHSRYIVGADGHNSRIRAAAGITPSSTTRQRVALRQHFEIAPWSNLVEVHWGPAGQAYVTPISHSEICVAFVGSKKFASVASALSQFPSLQPRLASASRKGEPRGAITLSSRLHRITSGNIALIGDASGSVDAVTGQGLALAFRQALALAEALVADDLSAYEHAHARILRLPRYMSSALLFMGDHPVARSLALLGFSLHPKLFPHLMGIHTGSKTLRFWGTDGLMESLFAS